MKLFMKKGIAVCISAVLTFATILTGGCSGGMLSQKEKLKEPAITPSEKEKEVTEAPEPTKKAQVTSTISEDDQDFLKKANYIKKLVDVYFLNEKDNEEMYEGMYRGMMDTLGDPYSCYYTKEEYSELMESMEGMYCGIGALVSQNASTKIITIVRPFVDGPAFKAGLLPGDIIVEINGEDISTWDINIAVKEMKGEQGTTVSMKVWRPTEGQYIEKELTRDLIEVETVTHTMLEDSIGYIFVMEFDDITTEQFESAVEDLNEQGMKGLIVDVRDNPGGLFDTAVDMLDHFIDKDLIVYTLDKYGNKEETKSHAGKTVTVPTVVLVNGNSASASEIFSGALQDYGLATIIGTQSFGKGIVQSVIPLADGSAVKMTVSKYYTPAGRCIHGTGITPDVVVELNEELLTKVVITKEEDNQLQAAIQEVKNQIK